MKVTLAVVALIAALLVPFDSAWAQTSGDVLVNVGSLGTPFPQNKQNEPAIAINPANPMVIAVGANDEIDLAPCDGNDCPFTPGVGFSGIYFSLDGGASWIQPEYDGFGARSGTPVYPDAIGTVPNYYENGLVSNGDPILAFGPRPGENGEFSWSEARLYYSGMATNLPAADEPALRGLRAIVVSHVDDIEAAADGDNDAWSDPVILATERQSVTTNDDRPSLWADDAESSPYFGNVYVCWVSFRGFGASPSTPEPLVFSRSVDGGETFSTPNKLTEASNSGKKARQGCAIRSDSKGTVYLFWWAVVKGQSIQYLARSYDGGVSFEREQIVANVVDVGGVDDLTDILTFDGIAGARTDSYPIVDIANGAPSGENASDRIVMVWPDAHNGLNNEEALLQYSTDRGDSWSSPVNVAEAEDRPNFPAVAISPDGSDIYVAYNGFLDPFQKDLNGERRFQGVVRHADFEDAGDAGAWSTLYRGEVGDGRGSGANSMAVEFLGDYNYLDATNDYVAAAWIDARNAGVCPAVNAYRAGLAGLSELVAAPAPATDCPGLPSFGDTDIYAIALGDPTDDPEPAPGNVRTSSGASGLGGPLFLPLLSGSAAR